MAIAHQKRVSLQTVWGSEKRKDGGFVEIGCCAFAKANKDRKAHRFPMTTVKLDVMKYRPFLKCCAKKYSVKRACRKLNRPHAAIKCWLSGHDGTIASLVDRSHWRPTQHAQMERRLLVDMRSGNPRFGLLDPSNVSRRTMGLRFSTAMRITTVNQSRVSLKRSLQSGALAQADPSLHTSSQ